ncbi:MAG: dTMP kinase [Actinomycetota bacterium]|nr:dTMP kinase [Actinomycetota bacterium]
MHRGTFITLEGIEGSGKTTQLGLLEEFLKSKGFDVLATREPGGTRIGNKIRDIILSEDSAELNDRAEVLLCLASRAQHIAEVVAPALEEGKIVISDRYVDSTIAYQGFGRGLSLEKLLDMNRWTTQDLNPHLTIVLNLPLEEGLGRARAKGADRFEGESLEFHGRVQDGFMKLAQLFDDRCCVVDGSGSKEEVHQRVVSALQEALW